MSKNTSSDGEITQQTNLRRALDFIGDEIRSASLVNQVQPKENDNITLWTLSPPASSTAAESILYLEIPTPVDSVPPSSPILTIQNHGLVKGNAVKISGANLSSASPSSINSTATYYVSATSLTTNTLQLVKSDNSSITFTTTPQNFAIRRLVFYYPSNYVNDSGWKGQQVLYRATGNCGSASTTADPANCLVMVDSLVDLPAATATTTNSPFFSALVGSKQATISLNGKLCTPPTIENSCATTVNNKVSVSITAISRATLQ